MKPLTWIIIAVVALIVIGGLYFLQGGVSPPQTTTTTKPTTTTQPTVTTQPTATTTTIVATTTTQPQGNIVEIKNLAFNPSEITIKKGDSVKWVNNDSTSHTVTFESVNESSSSIISKGNSYSHTFNQTGNFSYYCSIHMTMKGKVIVE